MKVRDLSRKLRTNLASSPGAETVIPAHFERGEISGKEAAVLKPVAAWTLVAFLLAAALAGPARAAYDDLGTSARTSGMSNAFTAVADDVYAIYYNPAGLALIDRPEVATTYSMIVTGLSDGSNVQNSFIGYAQPIKGGEYGTAGLGWNYFSLDSLYRESSLFLSYGNRLTPDDVDLPIYGGFSTKYLYRSINPGALANNSISNTGQVLTGVADPLLQNGAKSNFDVDLGLLWQVMPHWDAGFQVQHLFAPNIAFTPGQTDTLQRNLKFGGAYRTPFSTIDADFDIVAAPDGTMERDLNLGVEKWLPTLLYGSFGMRAGLGYGTDDYRQLTIGLSYKIHRLQVDYGFVMPLGSFASTSGTQRIGLSWRFGEAPQAERLMGEMLLENLTQVAPQGTPEFNRQAALLVDYKRRALDLLLHAADDDANEGRFAAAYARAQEAQSLAPGDRSIAEIVERYRTAGLYFPDLSDALADRRAGGAATAAAATRDGLLDFVAGKDREALASMINARTLAPTASHDAMIRILQARLGEPMLGITNAPAAPPAVVQVSTAAPSEGPNASKRILDSTVALMELAFFQQEWDKVGELAGQVIALDSKNVLAYKRLAAAEHVRKHYPAALNALQAAHDLETDPSERARLKSYIDALKSQIARASKPPAPAVKTAAPANAGPEEVERLYEAGVELYAQGRLSEAMEAFRRCLQIDAGYVPAQRAYERVQSEQMQSGKSQ
jgi:tetratricopeptide (TPR) repeat protein